MSELKRKNCIAYIGLDIQLHGCVENSKVFLGKLQQWLHAELNPDFESDIDVEITETTIIKRKQ